MKTVLTSVFVLWVFVSTGYADAVYKWVDKNGVVNFTDDYTQIPPQYRNHVQMEELGEPLKDETPTLSRTPAQKGEAAKVDVYGTGEDYWRAKVQPWKKQLKEATENIESINGKISGRLKEEAGKSMSPTQWTMDLAYRKQLIEEKSQYEAQVREANEMLSKIAKEAEEAKANPEWLK